MIGNRRRNKTSPNNIRKKATNEKNMWIGVEIITIVSHQSWINAYDAYITWIAFEKISEPVYWELAINGYVFKSYNLIDCFAGHSIETVKIVKVFWLAYMHQRQAALTNRPEKHFVIHLIMKNQKADKQKNLTIPKIWSSIYVWIF